MEPSNQQEDRPAVTLPVRLTRFIGREREVADLVALLAATRLVTLVSAPGVGKTRLAVQVAAEPGVQFADGVRFVDLAPMTEPRLVPNAVAAAFGVRELPGRPLSVSSWLARQHQTALQQSEGRR